jgi:hypothetical protein
MVLITAVMVLFLGAVNASAVSISMDVLDNYIEVGEVFDVNVRVNQSDIIGGDELIAFEFYVFPISDFFSLTGYVLGPAFTDDLLITDFDISDLSSNKISAMTLNGITESDVLLATLKFSAGRAGKNPLEIVGKETDSAGLFYWINDPIDISASAEINIHSTAPVPEPSTLLLCFSALAVGAIHRMIYRKS